MEHAIRIRRFTFCLAVLPAGIVFSLLLLFPLLGLSQTPPSFSRHSFTSALNNSVILHGDLNNDGYEDLIIGSRVFLSKGNGTYTEISASLSAAPSLLADFNGDGKLDLIAGNHIYFGRGDGTFGSARAVPLPADLVTIAAADVNHDGKTDLLILTVSSTVNDGAVQVLLGDGDGTFRTGPASLFDAGGDPFAVRQFLIGDFNGDGNVDAVVTWLTAPNAEATTVLFLFGDGHGNFINPYSDPNEAMLNLTAADVNGDGVSDLIGTGVLYDQHAPFIDHYLTVYYGQSYGFPITNSIRLAQFGVGQVAVADFNGDGSPDIAVFETDCDSPLDGCTNTTAATMNVLSGTGNGAFAPDTPVSSLESNPGWPFAIRGDRDTRADLVYSNTQTSKSATFFTLLNTTTGNFPTCAAPNAAVGIALCSPTAGSTANSPANFAIGAAAAEPIRKVELWADGSKQLERYAGAFSNYGFLDASIPLAAGSHKIVVFAAGWDNSLQPKTFTLNVSASSCSAPTSTGVYICSPADGSSVSSPVKVHATAKVTGTIVSTQLWVDGVKNFNAPGSTTLTTSVSLAPGTHRLAVIAVNTSGQKWESAVNVTVQ